MPWCLQWNTENAGPVLHGCKLVDMLLAAGAPPVQLALAGEDEDGYIVEDEEPIRLPEGLARLLGPEIKFWVPYWALGALRCGWVSGEEGISACGACSHLC